MSDFSITSVAFPVLGDFVTLKSISVPDPLRVWKPYSKIQSLGNMGIRQAGVPVTSWHWNFLTNNQYDSLRVYCPGVQSDVHIYTIDNENDWKYAKVLMFWNPNAIEWSASRAIDFTIAFKVLAIETISA